MFLDKDVDVLVRVGSNLSKLIELKKVFNSLLFYVGINLLYFCKDEVVVLNLLMFYFRDEMLGRIIGML